MKIVVLLTLVVTLIISLFSAFGAEVTNNSVAIALMILLLALFADLKEFNFWGLSGKKKEEAIKKLGKSVIINEDTEIKPSPYKLRKAVKEDSPDQMESIKDTFLATSYDIDRLLRIIARSITRSTEETALLTPQAVLDFLEDEELLTPDACEAIESIWDIRTSITRGESVALPTLEASQKLAQTVHTQIKDWFDKANK